MTEINDWEETKVTNTINDYYLFTVKYPNSIFKNLAKKEMIRLVEIKEWEETKVKNVISTYDTFIDKHPDSKHIEEAKIEIKKLFEEISPEKPTYELYSNLSVEIRCPSVKVQKNI